MENPEQHHDADGLETFFSAQLKDASLQPSPGVWKGVELALDRDKEKRRRIFFWLFFAGIGITTCFVLLYAGSGTPGPLTKNNSSKQKNSAPLAPGASDTGGSVASGALHKPAMPASESAMLALTTDLVKHKIQLGAFKHPANVSIFKKLPCAISSELTADGLTRYYAETESSKENLERIREAGFKDAFIQDKSVIHSQKTVQQNTSASGATRPAPPVQDAALTSHSKNNAKDGKAVRKGKAAKISGSRALEDDLASAIPQTKENKQTGSTHGKDVTGKNMGLAENAQPALLGPLQQNKADSVASQVAILVQASDSLTTRAEKPDSALAAKAPLKDSLLDANPINKWSLSLTGGPNLFFNSPQSTVFNLSSEKHLLTYGAEINAGYRVWKNISLDFGVGYCYYAVRQDATSFKFSKYLSSDYTFYTSQGPVNVDKDVMLSGYSPLAPVDTFAANYSYTSKTGLVNVPLQLSWQFLSRDKFNLHASLGVNMSYVVSEYTRLDVIKEHETDEVKQHSVRVQPFNAALLLSLGCDIRLRRRLYLTIRPAYKYGLNNMSGTKDIRFRPDYLSAGAGIRIVF